MHPSLSGFHSACLVLQTRWSQVYHRDGLSRWLWHIQSHWCADESHLSWKLPATAHYGNSGCLTLQIQRIIKPWSKKCHSCVFQSRGIAQSPAVFGAMVTYIQDVLDMFGIELLRSKVRICMQTSSRLSSKFPFSLTSGCFYEGGGGAEQWWKLPVSGRASNSFQKRSSCICSHPP